MTYEPKPTAKLRWFRVPDFSGRPAVTEHRHYRDGDGWVLQQWWEWTEYFEDARPDVHHGEWRDVPVDLDYGR